MDDEILTAREIASLADPPVAIRTVYEWFRDEIPAIRGTRPVPVQRHFTGARRADVLAFLARRASRAGV